MYGVFISVLEIALNIECPIPTEWNTGYSSTTEVCIDPFAVCVKDEHNFKCKCENNYFDHGGYCEQSKQFTSLV